MIDTNCHPTKLIADNIFLCKFSWGALVIWEETYTRLHWGHNNRKNTIVGAIKSRHSVLSNLRTYLLPGPVVTGGETVGSD